MIANLTGVVVMIVAAVAPDLQQCGVAYKKAAATDNDIDLGTRIAGNISGVEMQSLTGVVPI
jgi:hypothetical protein